MNPGWDLQIRVLEIPYRDPFRIARDAHGAGGTMSTMIVELRSDRLPGLVGLGEGYPDAYYGETLATMPVVMDRLLGAVEPGDLDTTSVEDGGRGPRGDRRCVRRGRSAATAPRSAPSTSPSTISPARRPERPSIGSSGSPPRSPRPTSPWGSTSPPSSPSAPAGPAASRPSRSSSAGPPTSRRWRRSGPSTAGPIRVDANTGWTPEIAAPLIPELVRLGVELIEQPFPPRRYDWLLDLQAALAPADRRRRERRHDRGPRRARRDRRRGQRQARQVRRGRPGGADAGPGPGARLPDLPRLHGGDERRDRRLGGGRFARRVGRPRRLPPARRRPVRRASSSVTTADGACPTPPGLGWPPAPDGASAGPGAGEPARGDTDSRPADACQEGAVTDCPRIFRVLAGPSTERVVLWTSRWEGWWTRPFRPSAGIA